MGNQSVWCCAAALLPAAVLLSGCVLEPRAARDERRQLREAGAAYSQSFDRRTIFKLPAAPTTDDILRRALLVNGEVEAAYFDWAAAVARIKQAGAYPNTSLSIGLAQSLDGGRIKSFDQTTITAGPDAETNLAYPTKVAKAADVAYQMARATGRRFVATKLEVQRQTLGAWFDYALTAEQARLARQQLALLVMVQQTASSRLQAGGPQADVLRADVAARLANDAAMNLDAQLARQRASLNAMLARPADAPLAPPATLPDPRPLMATDAALIAAAARNDPELQSLDHLVAGRADALELARLQYIPDFNPTFGITGGASQLIGLGITLPTVLPRIEGMIDEARADLRSAEATYRQKRQDRAAALVAAIVALRNSERQTLAFERDVIPLATRVVESTTRSYSAGTSSYLDLIDAQRTLLDARRTSAEARMSREKTLAEIEALAGLDVETLASAPTTAPAISRNGDSHE